MPVLICAGAFFVDCDSLIAQSLAVTVDFEPPSRRYYQFNTTPNNNNARSGDTYPTLVAANDTQVETRAERNCSDGFVSGRDMGHVCPRPIGIMAKGEKRI